MVPVAEALYYQENDFGLFIRALGHITAAVSTDLREVILERLSQAPVPPLLGVDLSACEYMDSTFMGLIVGFRKRLHAFPGKTITLYRPNPICTSLLKSIGLTRLVEISAQEVSMPPFMENIAGQGKATAEFLLNVHENLMELNDDNKAKFSVLTKVLKDQIDSGPGEGK